MKRTEEIEKLKNELEDKRANMSQMVSTREITVEREKRKIAEFEAKRKLEETKRESDRKSDMAISRTKTLEKEVARITRENDNHKENIKEQEKKTVVENEELHTTIKRLAVELTDPKSDIRNIEADHEEANKQVQYIRRNDGKRGRAK